MRDLLLYDDDDVLLKFPFIHFFDDGWIGNASVAEALSSVVIAISMLLIIIYYIQSERVVNK